MTSETTHKSTGVRIGDDPKPYTLTIIDLVDRGDSTVVTVELSWLHGIYRTHESERFVVIFQAIVDDLIVNSDGTILELRPELNGVHQAIVSGLAHLA